MKINQITVLKVLVIVEAVVIMVLAAGYYRGVRVTIQRWPYPFPRSPLEEALQYNSPDKTFEELVTKYPGWINYRERMPDDKAIGLPLLATCALLNRTNYIRILIADGANVAIATNSLHELGASNAINLIQLVDVESKH
jgi:hypothetical protein